MLLSYISDMNGFLQPYKACHRSPLRLRATSCWHHASVLWHFAAFYQQLVRRRKNDLSVPASSKNCLHSKNASCSESHMFYSCTQLPWKWIRLRPSAQSWSETQHNPQEGDLSVVASSSFRQLLRSAGSQGQPVACSWQVGSEDHVFTTCNVWYLPGCCLDIRNLHSIPFICGRNKMHANSSKN